MFYKKIVLRNFAKFTGKHMCRSLFFNRVIEKREKILYWKRDSGGVFFHESFTKFLTTPFLIEHLRWLLLHFFHSYSLHLMRQMHLVYICQIHLFKELFMVLFVSDPFGRFSKFWGYQYFIFFPEIFFFLIIFFILNGIRSISNLLRAVNNTY